ncbi:MAG: DUF4159 domain-containing protein [Bacteroidota bacterium]|nr:DUF4159 domain-containing protein [Bacteroidota bacterium]
MLKKIFSLLMFTFVVVGVSNAQQQTQIALMKYNGGGDWYSDPTALPNLIAFCNTNLNTSLAKDHAIVEPGSSDIFNYPFIHLTGHGNIIFTESEAKNLRKYLKAGGFLHIDDNYGLDKYIRPQMKKVFPELEFIELPFSHPIYHQKYNFKQGLPKIHEHDGKAPQGFAIIYKGKVVCFYTYESDLGDGWEDPAVHHDSQKIRTEALKMGANIIQFAFTF